MLEGRAELEGDPELFGVATTKEEDEALLELGVGLELSGRELAPSICCCSWAVNVPVMLVNWNLAEKAKAGNCGFAVSLRESDSIRTKLYKKRV